MKCWFHKIEMKYIGSIKYAGEKYDYWYCDDHESPDPSPHVVMTKTSADRTIYFDPTWVEVVDTNDVQAS